MTYPSLLAVTLARRERKSPDRAPRAVFTRVPTGVEGDNSDPAAGCVGRCLYCSTAAAAGAITSRSIRTCGAALAARRQFFSRSKRARSPLSTSTHSLPFGGSGGRRAGGGTQ
eukprot:234960-Prymnesium_polylepis.1